MAKGRTTARATPQIVSPGLVACRRKLRRSLSGALVLLPMIEDFGGITVMLSGMPFPQVNHGLGDKLNNYITCSFTGDPTS